MHAMQKNILELYDDLLAIQDFPLNNSIIRLRDNKNSLTRKMNTIYIAAAIFLIIAITGSILYFSFNHSSSNEQIFSDNFTPYPNIITRKSINEHDLQAAMFYYDTKSYDSAVLLFDKILTEEPGRKSIMLYKANSLLAAGMTKEAILVLETILYDSSEYNTIATWYLSLALLKAGETEKAKMLFLDLAVTKSSYSNRAKIILDQMK